MCGRFTLTKDCAYLLDFLAIENYAYDFTWAPNYNIAPTQSSPILTFKRKQNIECMRWGLIPHWTKNCKIGMNMINARSETIVKKSSFRNLIQSQRCIVITDGYYEWQKTSIGRQPYYIHHPQNKILTLAGLWDKCVDEKQREWITYTIITTESALQINHIHNRMPAIINYENIDIWLDAASNLKEVFYLPPPY